PPPTLPLFPYTTLFRSDFGVGLSRGRLEDLEPAPAGRFTRLSVDPVGKSQLHGWHGQSLTQRPRRTMPGRMRPQIDCMRPPSTADRKSTRLNSSHVKIS